MSGVIREADAIVTENVNRTASTSEQISENINKTSRVIVNISENGEEVASSLAEQVIVLKQLIGRLQGS